VIALALANGSKIDELGQWGGSGNEAYGVVNTFKNGSVHIPVIKNLDNVLKVLVSLPAAGEAF
jgi:hypothetical protein